MWAKRISNSATAMACAACIATAATLPVMGTAAEQLAEKTSVKLSALSDIDAFSALGAESLADIDAFSALGAESLADIDAFSAIPVFVAVATAPTLDDAITALGDYDALSAIPVFRDVATADTLQDAAAALGGYDALSAVDTFLGDGPIGADGETPIGGVFTGGGIDALAPDADGNGGYAALSALPVFFGPDTSGNAPFGPGVFRGGGIGALSNYDALSAIPALLPSSSTMTTAATAAPENTSTPTTGSGPVRSLVNTVTSALPGGGTGTGTQSPQSLAPQAVSAVLPTPKADNSGPALNITRDSKKFTPESIGDSPILFGNGSGVDNGIRGWGSALKKLGIGGGEESSSGTGK